MKRKKRVFVEEAEQEQESPRRGCLSKIAWLFVIMLAIAVIAPNRSSDKQSTATAIPKSTVTAKATSAPTKTLKPAATEKPTATPAIPGTYRPGIEGTNAYDITVAMKEVGLQAPARQNCTDGYIWISENYTEDSVSYNIEIETDKKYRVTSMQIMMSGGNNNFVQWACSCMFGEKSEQVEWLKENMWGDNVVTKTFGDDVWTINPLPKGVVLTVQHVDAEAWYLSII